MPHVIQTYIKRIDYFQINRISIEVSGKYKDCTSYQFNKMKNASRF